MKQPAKGHLYAVAEFSELKKSGADAQIKPYADDADHGGNAPDKIIDSSVDLCDKFQHEKFSFSFSL